MARARPAAAAAVVIGAMLASFACACAESATPAPVGPTSGTCGKGCERACNERCAATMAQCESSCDAQSPMDMGNTSRQSSLPREENPVCRRNCESQDQTCIRTCNAQCPACE